MRTALIAISIAASTALAGTAVAEGGSLKDAPQGVVYDWSGVYVGGHIGRGWSGTDTAFGPGILLDAYDFLNAPISSSQDLDGWLAGGHVGLQRQFGRLVLGVEASLTETPGGFDGKSSKGFADGAPVRVPFLGHIGNLGWIGESSVETKVSNIFTATGRVGYASDRWLGYVKGGYASAEIGLEHGMDGSAAFCLGRSCTPSLYIFDIGASASSKKRHDGWTIGGGLEYAIHPGVILGVEYNYIDLRAKTHSGSGEGFIGLDLGRWGSWDILDGPVKNSIRVDPDAIHAVYARLSLKLGHQPEAAVPLK